MRRVAKIAVVIVLLGSVAACSSGTVTAPRQDLHESEDVCPNEGDWGDVVAQNLAEDEHGEFCKIQIRPQAKALEWNAENVDELALETYGFATDQALALQQTAVRFVAEELSDSLFLEFHGKDDEAGVAAAEWNAQSDEYDFVYAPEPGDVFFTGMTPLVRDGSARSAQTLVDVVSVSARESAVDGSPTLTVWVHAQTFYRVDDSGAYDFLRAWDRYAGTSQELVADWPMFGDGATNHLPASLSFLMAFDSAGSITGNAVGFAVDDFREDLDDFSYTIPTYEGWN